MNRLRIKQLFFTATAILIFIPNLRLYVPRATIPPQSRLTNNIQAELRFIKQSIENGAGADMQALFPEGDFFLNVLYGLSWVNVGLQLPQADPQRLEAIQEATWAWENLGSEASKRPFQVSQSLAPSYGIFYTGWRTYLLGGILLMQDPDNVNQSQLAQFTTNCAAIAEAVSRSPTPFLSAYPSASWPVDMLPAMVALKIHGRLVNDDYEPIIEQWFTQLPSYLDTNTGLLPHRTQYATGRPLQGARGTSQVLILRFMAELDPAFATGNYNIFRENYVIYRWGLPGVLEYPKGIDGIGDVDSGPLLDGVSLSATAVMLGTSRVFGDTNLSNALWHSGEMLGFPIRWNGQKRYWFGILPVGDAFVVWSKTAVSWLEPMPQQTFPRLIPWWWRLPFHLLSLLGLVLLWRLFRPIRREQKGP
ncbi:MAG: hypothetical protein AAF490_15300 [Chloroflexota bacterium]